MSFAFGHYFFPGRAEAQRCFEINILIFVVNLLVFFVKHLLYLNIHAIAFRSLIQILQFFCVSCSKRFNLLYRKYVCTKGGILSEFYLQ